MLVSPVRNSIASKSRLFFLCLFILMLHSFFLVAPQIKYFSFFSHTFTKTITIRIAKFVFLFFTLSISSLPKTILIAALKAYLWFIPFSLSPALYHKFDGQSTLVSRLVVYLTILMSVHCKMSISKIFICLFVFHFLLATSLSVNCGKTVKFEKQWRDPKQAFTRSYFYQHFNDQDQMDTKDDENEDNDIPIKINSQMTPDFQFPMKPVVHTGQTGQTIPPSPSHPLNPSINVALLNDRFKLVGVRPLINSQQARASVPRVSGQMVANELRQSPFASSTTNGMTFITLNNQRFPLRKVVQSLVAAGLGPIGDRPSPPPKQQWINRFASNINNPNEDNSKESNEVDDGGNLWFKSTIDTIDHGYDDRLLPNRQPKFGVGQFSQDISRFDDPKLLKKATLGSLGYQLPAPPSSSKLTGRRPIEGGMDDMEEIEEL